MNFYLGCAVWSYKEWVGNLYPPKTKAADFLSLYSRRFTTVEGNTTFYAIPSLATIAKWIAQTPVGFKFCPKLYRQYTHQGLLSPHIAKTLDFLQIMANLGDRLGTIFIQLPPSYTPEYFEDLTQFLTPCSQSGLALALEVRHQNWFCDPYRDRLQSLLTRLNISTVLLDTRPIYNCPDDPQLNIERRKPQVPLQVNLTDDTGFIRFISHPQQQYNLLYLQQWVTTCHHWLNQGKTIYFFVHCPQEVYSPNTAKYFFSLLQQQNNTIPNLPWNEIDLPPTQLNLF
ncbi:hypothetical protein NIES4102_06370 [Chondrocystis sp. NIES-4102]|nr:hypothetical protein NIES4102_06370 [Chondrocystis sp. NIES-4102]